MYTINTFITLHTQRQRHTDRHFFLVNHNGTGRSQSTSSKLETVPYVIGGSFCVKGRNCALDVCWEGKKLRVICSHLNPSSVMHLYARDLDDLRSLMLSRGRDTHVHICVDAQTGLGTMLPRPHSANICSATTVSHRVEKQRMLECVIMENLRAILNVDDGHVAQESRLSGEASSSLYAFTDGFARKFSRKEMCSGWSCKRNEILSKS